MTSPGYLRYPHIHGDLLTFVADDDVWLVPVAGGRAWRLSAGDTRVSYPRFSPDGTKIAWTSWRDGCPEVYLADTEGGDAARLTYWGDQYTRVTGWTPSGEILAVTAAGQPRPQFTWAHLIPVEDAPPSRLPCGPVTDIALEQAGTVLLSGRLIPEPAYWKRYRGGAAGRLWVSTMASPEYRQVLAHLGGQFAGPMLIGGRLVFLSDHDGTGNIYSSDLDGRDLRQHTSHDGLYARNPSTDGKQVVYHVAGDIWILDDLDSKPHPVSVTLGSSAAAHGPQLFSGADHLDDLDCDQAGRASVIEVRGTIHWLTHRDGPARALSVDPAGHARMPRVLGRTGTIAWIADAGGNDALVIARIDGEPGREAGPEAIQAGGGELGSVVGMAAAPDGAKVAVAARDGRVLVVDMVRTGVTEVASSDDGEVSGLAWSPDSAWLAWSQPGPRPLRRIRLARIADGLVTDVTDGRFADIEPVFTADGRYLAFLSARSFDPVYDAHSFDMSFPLGSRPYLVPLAATTPSPFAPLPDGVPVSRARTSSDPGRDVVEVDIEGIAGRVVAVPVGGARYSSLYAVTGGLAWLRSPAAGVPGEAAGALAAGRGRPALERLDLHSGECAELATGIDWFTVSGDGTRLVIGDHDKVRVQPSHRAPAPGEPVWVDLARARFHADPAALWRHAYAEAGRLMSRDFWTADMSGLDWEAVLATYRPLLRRICCESDFADLLWEVFGELSTSHAFVIAPPASKAESLPAAVGQLGADISRGDAGRWQIDRVLPGESSDPRARAPLAAPGLAIRAGDELLAVGGRPVDPVRGPWPLLVGAADRAVELVIRSAGSRSRTAAEPRRAVVVPLRDERWLRYQDWVSRLRRTVREMSEDRIGYLHIPDMMGEGWANFHRDFRTETRYDALIVDVRGNQGGHVSQLIVEKLARRIIGWKVGRWQRPQPYPQDAPRGPVVVLADEFSGSDGEIVAVAIRVLGLGTVVGARTWGGVTAASIPGESLIDGTRITVPRYAFSFSGYGRSVENHGLAPDVDVLVTPGDWGSGRDPQLETAIRIALGELADGQSPVRPSGPAAQIHLDDPVADPVRQMSHRPGVR